MCVCSASADTHLGLNDFNGALFEFFQDPHQNQTEITSRAATDVVPSELRLVFYKNLKKKIEYILEKRKLENKCQHFYNIKDVTMSLYLFYNIAINTLTYNS